MRSKTLRIYRVRISSPIYFNLFCMFSIDMHSGAALLLILLDVIAELGIHKRLISREAAFLKVLCPEKLLIYSIAEKFLASSRPRLPTYFLKSLFSNFNLFFVTLSINCKHCRNSCVFRYAMKYTILGTRQHITALIIKVSRNGRLTKSQIK